MKTDTEQATQDWMIPSTFFSLKTRENLMDLCSSLSTLAGGTQAREKSVESH